MASRSAPATRRSKVLKTAKTLHELSSTGGTSLDSFQEFFGLAVAAGTAFDVEIWLIGDTPIWRVELTGLTDGQQPLRRLVGENQAHLKTTIRSIPNGDYFLSIVASLVAPGSQFKLFASSTIDDDRVELSMIPGLPVRTEMRPVRVG